MEASGAELLTLSDLLRRSRPLSGAASLSSSTSRRIPVPNPREEPTTENPSLTLKILVPLNHPVVLVGTVILPVYDEKGLSIPFKCPSSNSACFRFSDGTSTVCCDVLNFGVPMLGEKIRVLAFNFIPFKHGGGFLEIVKWSFSSSSMAGLRPCSSIASFPLTSGAITAFEDGAKARYNVLGAVESVSPVFIVPCSMTMESNGRHLRGFLVEFMICGCQLCKSKVPLKELVNSSFESHSYSEAVFVYFCGSASRWHPAITKLISSVVVLSGLKKKLMYIEKEESQLVFVVTEKSLLHLLGMPRKWSTHVKTGIKGEGECGHYSGIVRGMYMQGMVVELDKEVWLLLTGQQLILPHSIRIGALIAVKNAHFVRAKFAFTEVLILGHCFKSSIMVGSFSPLETGCHVKPQMQSLLGIFIASLAFSARLWMLLAVSCFLKKFAGILPEKEILGSKRKEGLSQAYARSCLPSWAIRSQHGVFLELCKHVSASCKCGPQPYDSELKLVVPLSTFILYCEAMRSKMPQGRGQACQESDKSDKSCCLCFGGGTHSESVRRIIPSQDIGIILFGTLKISPASGRLQLFDATGSVDVLIPDLPSTWKSNGIYEVSEYSIIIEGMPQTASGHSKEHHFSSLSCKSIFNCTALLRKMSMGIFVYFHLRNATYRDFSFRSCDVPKDEHEELSGKFHVLQVVHKFPVLQKFPGDLVISERSSAFVEAIILPWDLFLAGNNGGEHFSEAMKSLSNHWARVSRKRQKTDGISTTLSSGSLDDVNNFRSDRSAFSISSRDGEIDGLIDINSYKIPCLATVRNSNKMVLVSSGILYSTKREAKTGSCCKPSTQKILMEFKFSNLSQYQGLQIDGYYIVKHHGKNSSFRFLDSDYAWGEKILITSETKLRSLSIFSSDTPLDNGSSSDAPLGKSHFSTNEIFLGYEIRIPAKAYADYSSVTCSEIHLVAYKDLLGPLELDLKEIQCQFTKMNYSLETVNLSRCNGTNVSLPLSSKAPGFGFPFPDGNLICIRGDVISVHNIKSHKSLVNSNCWGNWHGDISSVSIHILNGNHTVEIFGSLRKHAFPIGLGPGVNATFYRILKLSAQNRFMLTPISFIEIDSVRMVNDHFPCHANTCSTSDSSIVPTVASSCLISQLVPCSSSNSIQLRCRVVDVGMLILERDGRSGSLKSKLKCRAPPPFNIPIAAFVVEDGSSSCVCWANGEQASTLLRLSETLPRTALGSSYWALKWVGGGNNTCGSSYYSLERILKKHGRITMKNYGSSIESCQDLSFSVSSENVLSNSDESLLQYVIFNACLGVDLTIVGNNMDSAAVKKLQEQHSLHVDTELDSFQHLWAREVHRSDPLKEARRTIEELLAGNCYDEQISC
ncbi:LOW QUALITY PROTEIN: CST complex subunit CTC1 [Punica granatum]|uniref:CST complex subunit CTC1 n=1 Tax=Punica granatum TaxID=22663 RepID=A0A6P8E8Q5_PUNGR|nr:LOW QUALITY PROTEIN: CST complex subunit CTC1 [Punica granatum]